MIKNIESAKSPTELHNSVKLLMAYATISDDDLVNNIKRLCDGLNRVGSPASLAIASIADKALHEALEYNSARGRAERAADLKHLSLWLGMVEMGWI